MSSSRGKLVFGKINGYHVTLRSPDGRESDTYNIEDVMVTSLRMDRRADNQSVFRSGLEDLLQVKDVWPQIPVKGKYRFMVETVLMYYHLRDRLYEIPGLAELDIHLGGMLNDKIELYGSPKVRGNGASKPLTADSSIREISRFLQSKGVTVAAKEVQAATNLHISEEDRRDANNLSLSDILGW